MAAPSSRHNGRTQELKRRIALEAARLMSEHGIRDFALAKRKAAERLGAHEDAALPKNAEIEAALREHQRLFQSDVQPQHLRHLRAVACDAMKFFVQFEPRLVGAVLDGSADRHSAITLHLFADAPEDVALFLQNERIPYEEQTRRLRLAPQQNEEFPVLLFSAEDVALDLTVLPRDAIRQAPLDRIDEKPMRRATVAMLEQLLADDERP